MVVEVCPPTMSLLFVIVVGFLSSSHAHTYKVGGDDGWTLHSFENYGHWAKRHRFQINDVLVFKYKKGDDYVLVVNKDDYLTCNKDNPIKTLKNGHSKFKFTEPGPFFFISGHEQNCEKGQKLIVIVLSTRHRNNTHNAPSPPPHEAPLQPPSSSPFLSPTTHAPRVEPPSHSLSPSPYPAPKTPTDVPPVNSPSHSPAPSHAPPVEAPSHSPFPSPASATRTQPPSHPPSPSPISHHSPSPASPKAEPLQHRHHAPTPKSHPTVSPPHHAPALAPTPSSAPAFDGSFALFVGISVVTTMISVGFV